MKIKLVKMHHEVSYVLHRINRLDGNSSNDSCDSFNDDSKLKSLPNNFTKEFTVEVDNQKYRVIIEAEKFDRQK